MTVTSVALLALAFVALLGVAHFRKWRARAWQRDWAVRPPLLKDAELVYIERLFRAAEPVAISAKVDRAYRLPSGTLVLVELKTRHGDKPSSADVIQLSAQRVAIAGSSGEKVASHGYVLIAEPGADLVTAARRVELLPSDQVVNLVRRRELILAGRISPRYAATLQHCQGCAFKDECGRLSCARLAGDRR